MCLVLSGWVGGCTANVVLTVIPLKSLRYLNLHLLCAKQAANISLQQTASVYIKPPLLLLAVDSSRERNMLNQALLKLKIEGNGPQKLLSLVKIVRMRLPSKNAS